MKKFILIALAMGFAHFTFSQEADTIKPWKTGANFSLTFSQTSLTNWSAGGENSLSSNGYINWFGDYKKGKSIWENRLDLAYGLTKQGTQDFRKNDDKIDLSSKYGLQAKEKWYYSVLFNFKSQFADGFDYLEDTTILLSGFLAPAYTSIGIGMDWKPKDYFSLYISPVTARWIIVNNQDLADMGAFGVDPAEYDDLGHVIKNGQKVKSEFGALLRAEFIRDIAKNVNLKTKLELFSNYLDKPQEIDVYWDIFLTMNINNWLAATLNTTLVYDADVMIMDKDGNIGPRTQFKEIFGIGLTYSIGATQE
ncbi:MAG: DUF3078 domain-containing protein [Bacteroidales bacterium]|nr:DUF3078 domain-containing protein [Bacteroidales bacterium]